MYYSAGFPLSTAGSYGLQVGTGQSAAPAMPVTYVEQMSSPSVYTGGQLAAPAMPVTYVEQMSAPSVYTGGQSAAPAMPVTYVEQMSAPSVYTGFSQQSVTGLPVAGCASVATPTVASTTAASYWSPAGPSSASAAAPTAMGIPAANYWNPSPVPQVSSAAVGANYWNPSPVPQVSSASASAASIICEHLSCVATAASTSAANYWNPSVGSAAAPVVSPAFVGTQNANYLNANVGSPTGMQSVQPISFAGRGNTIIFLDVDGVLHSTTAVLTEKFSQSCMQALARIIKTTGAEIVLSSSWRTSETSIGYVNDALASYGLNRIIGKTPQLCGGREEEVCQWVDEHAGEVARWVAIDDIDLAQNWASQSAARMKDHFVHTNASTGLTEADADKAIAFISRQ